MPHPTHAMISSDVRLYVSLICIPLMLMHAVSPTDFWATVGVLLTVYLALIIYFAVMDGHSGSSNKALFEKWARSKNIDPDSIPVEGEPCAESSINHDTFRL